MNETMIFLKLLKTLSREEKKLLDRLILENDLRELKHTMVDFLSKYKNVLAI